MAVGWAVGLALSLATGASEAEYPIVDGAYQVRPSREIQPAIELAGHDPTVKRVVVHAGVYRPSRPGQALIWLNHRHDGVVVEAKGEVTLTAANPEVADREAESYPAIVNHVVYLGDGLSRKTVLRGFKITGANNFVTDRGGAESLEPHFAELRQTEGFYGHLFFFTDGGAIKIFGRSYPTLDGLEIVGNYSSPCAGGISIEHRGFTNQSVLIKNCVFRGNRSLVTGSAVDLLPGSAVELSHCLFVDNISNTGTAYLPAKGNIDWPEIPKLVATTVGYLPQHGSGALTIFFNSRVVADRCTFTRNFNGVDDRGPGSVFRNCLFWQNDAPGGKRPGRRYELDVARAEGISGCFLNGDLISVTGAVPADSNTLDCPDPEFDSHFVPRHPAFAEVGYRPSKTD